MKTALTIILLVVSIILSIVVMKQEGKDASLSSSLSGGGGDTYWSKNKGKSKESVLRKITVVLAVIFMVLALLLSSKFI